MPSPRLDEQQVFHVALAIADPAIRLMYLEQICAGDANLRERTEDWLRVHEQEQAILKLDPDLPSTQSVSAVKLQVGQQIDRFKLLQKIGEGGFGVVYMAEQVQPVRRRVALKVIKPGMDSHAVIARFEAERQALAMMDHPNIARVIDGGSTEEGRPYFVMELVRGVPITEFCDEHKLPTKGRLELFITVCQAVQHAHQKGIIHRDLKPSNILVTLHDSQPVVKVIDFGVAKAIHQQLTEKTLFTAFGQMVGTPQYMSPEQAEMSGLDVDTRSDVYSLGVILYELLTGSTPLEVERLRKAGYVEMQRMIKDEEPPRPSNRLSTSGEKLTTIALHRGVSPERLQSQVRGDLDWIVMKALEKDRNRRYETVSAFASDAGRFLNSEPVIARPQSKLYRLKKYAVRNRASLIASGLVGLSLFAAAIVAFVGWRRATTTLRQLQDQHFQQTLVAAMSSDPGFDQLIDTATELKLPGFQMNLLKGQRALYSGKSDEAARYLRAASEQEPKSVAAKAALNIADLQSGNWYDWIQASTAIAEMQSESPEDYLLQAQAIMVVSNPKRALELVDRAIELRHSQLALAMRAEITAWLAIEEGDSEILEPALAAVRALRETFPNTSAFVSHADLFVHLAALVIGDPANYESLEKEVQNPIEALDRFPEYPYGRLHRAYLFELLKDADKSERDWRELAKLHAQPNWKLGYAQRLYRNGKKDEARAQLATIEGSRVWIYGTDMLMDGCCRKSEIQKKLEGIQFDLREAYGDEFKLRNLILIGEHQQAAELASQWLKEAPIVKGTWPEFDRRKMEHLAEPKRFTEQDLLDAAGRSPLKLSDAYCLLGMERLHNDKEAAKVFFRKAIGTRAVWFTSYQIADSILQQLESNENWPIWLTE